MSRLLEKRFSRLAVDDQGIAVWTLDYPELAINKLSAAVWAEIDALAGEFAADATIKAVVVASAKPNVFLAGADIHELQSIDAGQALASSQRAQAVFDRLEQCGKPVVAAVDGVALGGGMELVLACHAAIASDNPKVKLGLPETKLGLLPGAGGTQRMARRIGIDDAADLVVSGRSIDGARALALGLVEAVVPAAGLIAEAKGRAAARAAAGTPAPEWGALAVTDVETRFLRQALRLDRADRRFEAQLAALTAVVLGAGKPFAEGLRLEREAFAVVAPGEAARELIARFLSGERL